MKHAVVVYDSTVENTARMVHAITDGLDREGTCPR
jgi:flavorubredoxin